MDNEYRLFTEETLTVLSTRDLASYLADGLQMTPTYQMIRQDMSPAKIVSDTYTLSTNPDFQQRMRGAIGTLLAEWIPKEETAAFGASLMWLTGYIQPEGGADILLKRFQDPLCESIIGDGEPLSCSALRAFLDFPDSYKKEGFWEPLLINPLYYETAFQAISLRNFSEGRYHIPTFLTMLVADDLPNDMKISRAKLAISMLLGFAEENGSLVESTDEEKEKRFLELKKITNLDDQKHHLLDVALDNISDTIL